MIKLFDGKFQLVFCGFLIAAATLFSAFLLTCDLAFADSTGGLANASSSSSAADASDNTMTLSSASTKGLIAEDCFTIISKANSKRIQVKSTKTSGGTSIVLREKNKSTKQKWYFRKASKNDKYSYRIQSVQSGRYLTLSSDGKIVEKKYASNQAQIWVASKQNSVYMFTNKKSGAVLTVSDSSKLTTAEENDSKSQLFALHKTAILANGTYYIQPKSSKKVLGVSGNLTKVGANVKLQSKSSDASKKWTVVRNSDGTYTFRNENSARVLSVQGKSGKKGSNVCQKALMSGKSSKWKLTLHKNGGISISSALNSKTYLGSSSLKSGSNSKLISSKNSKTAIFKFTSTKKSSVRNKMARKIRNIKSSTNWLLVANTNSCFVGIYKGKKGNWTPYAYFPCSPGAYGTPSKKGIFKVGSKGYAFGTSSYTCYYFTQYSGNYLFHSILYNAGTFSVQDGRMGVHASHGCIRLELANAKWINKNIPVGTTVYVY